MSLFRFLTSKKFFIHLGLAILFGVLLIAGTMFWLDAYTNHGETVKVPNFSGTRIENLDSAFAGTNFSYSIVDSVYDDDDDESDRGTVIEQDPEPGAQVKSGRKIYLTVIAVLPEQVKMPDLVDLTLRQAKGRLETYGLEVGELEYVPDIAKNVVLKQKYKGDEIPKDSLVVKGSKIDLVLGDGLSDTKVKVPYLINLTLEEADSVLMYAGLSKGAILPDESVEEDTLQAKIYRQSPQYTELSEINIGEPVDMWLTFEEEKIEYDSTITRWVMDTIPEIDKAKNDTFPK